MRAKDAHDEGVQMTAIHDSEDEPYLGPGPMTGSKGTLPVTLSEFGADVFNLDRRSTVVAGMRGTIRGSHEINYTFQRSARDSVMLEIGLAPAELTDGGEATKSMLDTYTKATYKVAVMHYLSIVLGSGVVTLPFSIASLGYAIGIPVLLAMGAIQYFLATRLLDAPIVCARHFQIFEDVGHALLGRFWYHTCSIIAAASLFGVLVIQLWEIWDFVEASLDLDCNWVTRDDENVCQPVNHKGYLVGIPCTILLLYPTFLWTTTKELQQCSKRAFTLIVLAGVGIVLASIMNLFVCDESVKDQCPVYNAWPNQDKKFSSGQLAGRMMHGVGNMCYAFGGLQVLPFILSDMLKDVNPATFIRKSYTYITAFYVVVGVAGYLCWGQHVGRSVIADKDPLRRSIRDLQKVWDPQKGRYEPDPAEHLCISTYLTLVVVVKAFLTFPLVFAPLYRSLYSYFAPEEYPGFTLRVPWAIRRLNRMKSAVRLLLCFFPLFAVRMVPSINTLFSSIGGMPNAVVQFVFPSVFGIIMAQKKWEKWAMIKGTHEAVGSKHPTPRRQGTRGSLMSFGKNDVYSKPQYAYELGCSIVSLVFGVSFSFAFLTTIFIGEDKEEPDFYSVTRPIA